MDKKEKKPFTQKNAYELNAKLGRQLEQYEKELMAMIPDTRTCKPKIQQRMKDFNQAYEMLIREIIMNGDY